MEGWDNPNPMPQNPDDIPPVRRLGALGPWRDIPEDEVPPLRRTNRSVTPLGPESKTVEKQDAPSSKPSENGTAKGGRTKKKSRRTKKTRRTKKSRKHGGVDNPPADAAVEERMRQLNDPLGLGNPMPPRGSLQWRELEYIARQPIVPRGGPPLPLPPPQPIFNFNAPAPAPAPGAHPPARVEDDVEMRGGRHHRRSRRASRVSRK